MLLANSVDFFLISALTLKPPLEDGVDTVEDVGAVGAPVGVTGPVPVPLTVVVGLVKPFGFEMVEI